MSKQDAEDKSNIRNYRKRILLVEDNRVNQLVTKKQLMQLGLEVIIAENGQIAIDLVSEQQFELILMDLEMPIIGGIAATQQIRERRLTRVPIIALTAHDNPGTRRLCRETKMNGYMVKPVTVDKLIPVLDKFLGN